MRLEVVKCRGNKKPQVNLYKMELTWGIGRHTSYENTAMLLEKTIIS